MNSDTYFMYYVQLSCFTLVFFLILCAYVVNAEIKKGSLRKTHARFKGIIKTDTSPNDTFNIILQFAFKSGYRVDDIDEKKLCVIFNERMTLTNYGSLYPIFVRNDKGKTIVEVGIISKLGFFSIGPINNKIIKRHLEYMQNGIKGALIAYKTNP
jgi:hypothetical protein